MAQHDRYISPFSTRYASDEMQYIFSDDNKFRTWRKLWIALAKAEQKQGLAITDEQLAELEALRVFHFSAPDSSRHLMSLIAHNQIPLRYLQFFLKLLISCKLIQTADAEIHLVKDIARYSRFHSVVCQDLKCKVEF